MPLIDDELAQKMRLKRAVEISNALANPKVSEAINTLIDEGVEPSLVHGCMTHLRRKAD